MGNGRGGLKRLGGGVSKDSSGGTTQSSGSYDTPKEYSDDELMSLAYHAFSDKAIGSHDFDEKEGKRTEKWFADNSNFGELMKDLDPVHYDAFEFWARGSFMRGQLYDGFDSLSLRERDYATALDEVLDASRIRPAFTVTRLTDWKFFSEGKNIALTPQEINSRVGELIPIKSYMATSAAADGLTIGDSTKPVMLKIHIPPNSIGAGMWIGNYSINGWGNKQREFLTNRDSVYKLGKTARTEKISIPTGRRGSFVTKDVTVVDVYFVGHTEDDYGKYGPSTLRGTKWKKRRAK